MKVAAGIVEYMDRSSLERCLESLQLGKGGIDTAFVIYGPFKGLRQDPSLDPCEICTKTLVFSYAARFSTSGRPPLIYFKVNEEPVTEIDARNQYLKMASERGYDWLLVIDSDEYIASNADWNKFHEQLRYIASLDLPHQIFDITFEGNISQRGPRPRLFYRPGSIKYWRKHYWWVLEETMTCYKGMSDAGRIVDGIIIMEDKSLRDPQYVEAIATYKKWQQENEGLVNPFHEHILFK